MELETLRNILYCYYFAKKKDGTFILKINDLYQVK